MHTMKALNAQHGRQDGPRGPAPSIGTFGCPDGPHLNTLGFILTPMSVRKC